MSATISTHEECFLYGSNALRNRYYLEAIAHFRKAIELERMERPNSACTKYISYLGLALSLAKATSNEGLKLCQQAVERDFLNPDLYCNLGIVYSRRRQKRLAFEAFGEALALKPGHRRTLEELAYYERRREPIIPFLPRTHALNRTLGRFRYRFRQRFARPPEESV